VSTLYFPDIQFDPSVECRLVDHPALLPQQQLQVSVIAVTTKVVTAASVKVGLLWWLRVVLARDIRAIAILEHCAIAAGAGARGVAAVCSTCSKAPAAAGAKGVHPSPRSEYHCLSPAQPSLRLDFDSCLTWFLL
jgi:hypothetical protein